MSTFSRQDQLPSLPVPSLVETLEKYIDSGTPRPRENSATSCNFSASAILTPAEKARVEKEAHEFQHSELGAQLQSALENRAKNHKNWVRNCFYSLEM